MGRGEADLAGLFPLELMDAGLGRTVVMGLRGGSRYILKVQPVQFDDALGLRCERRRIRGWLEQLEA